MSIVFLPPGGGGGAASVPDATDSTAGKIRISTIAESNSGTNDTTAMTPAKVKTRIDAALVGGVQYEGAYTGQSLITAKKGDLYVSDGAQTLGGVSLGNGDHVIFNQDASDPVTSSMFDVIDNTESDTLDTVTGRNATTTNSIQVGGLNIAGNYALPAADGTAGQVMKTDGAGVLSFVNQTGGATPTLDAVTGAGATTTNSIQVGGLNIAGNYALPAADGSAGQVMKTDGAGVLSFVNQTGGIENVVEDLSPQLGGALDTNSNAITSASNANVEITPHGTGFVKLGGNTNPGTVALYDEAGTNYIGLKAPLDADIAGDTTFTLPAADGTAGQVLKTDGAGVLSFVNQTGGATPTLDAVTGAGATTTNSIQVGGLNIAGNYALPAADGSAGQVMKTDGAGVLSFVNQTGGIENVVEDLSPQLGGALDTNSNAITSASNANVEITPHGTGFVKLGGNTNPGTVALYDEAGTNYIGLKAPLDADIGSNTTFTLPAADGTAGQVLKTDGAGVLSFVDQTGGGSGGSGFTYSAITTTQTASANYHYSCGAGNQSFTLTLPAVSGVSAGSQIRVKNVGTGVITISTNGADTIDGSSANYLINTQWSAITLVSSNAAWEII